MCFRVAPGFRDTILAERGVAVVIHGGFWRAAYDRHLMDDLCRDLAAAGWGPNQPDGYQPGQFIVVATSTGTPSIL